MVQLTSSTTVLSEPTFVPLNADGLPVSLDAVSLCDTNSESIGSYDSRDMPAYSELMHDASLAIAQVQKALNSSRDAWADGDGVTSSSNSKSGMPTQDTLSTDELKNAIITMMTKKEEVEEQMKRLVTDLEAEKSLVAGLRCEIDELRQSHTSQLEQYSEKTNALVRENNLLKHQLKKYVSAVQMLRRQGARDDEFPGIHIEAVQPPIPTPVGHIDYSEEAVEYEKKLVQVAEMHGELMEFNEFLQKQLLCRESQLKHLTEELVSLRGPLSSGIQPDSDIGRVLSSEASCLSADRPLINIWIPSAFLHGSQHKMYHVYQIYVRIRNEEWNTYRRYAEFYEFHCKLKKRNPLFSTYEFPPKKTFGKKDPKIVEVRRMKLQTYLRLVVAQLSRDFPELVEHACRQTLVQTVPFFSDAELVDKKKRRSHGRSSSIGGGRVSSVAPVPPSQLSYMGL